MDVCTRWNSTFLMINTFLEMKNALLKTDDYLREISDLQRRPTNFSQNEWNNLKRLAENLEPLSREDFVIIGEYAKCSKFFMWKLAGYRKSSPQLQLRLAAIESNKILRLSMLVDPRFAFDENFLLGFEWEILEDEFIHLIIREKDSVIPATSVSSERTFSMAGLLYANTLRNRLGAKMAENLMLIKSSLKKTMLAPSVEPDDDELDNKEEIEENVLRQQQID
uniref:HAT C-terminal dimerisation domain-containing protein n=1 Tax=Globodera rostochiensis TaxID=31243 RepID=A0A914HKS6_GLORO